MSTNLTGERGSASGDCDATQEQVAIGVGYARREHLLELVDHDEHDGAVIRQDPLDASQDAAIAVAELFEQLAGRVDGDAKQRGLECLERTGARDHRGREPLRRTLHPAGAQCRNEPGAHHRRLARTRRADNGQQPVVGLGEVGEQLVGQPIAAVEVCGIGLVERAKTLVRIGART